MVWLLGGALGGLLLAMGEAGHLPRWVLPPLLGAVGLLAGTIGGMLRYLLAITVQPGNGRSVVAELLIGTGIGVLIGTGLWRLGLGLTVDVALAAGAVLGALSGVGVGKNAGLDR